MTVISAEKDTEALTLTFVAEFDAPVERVWQLWEDPRQLERWWGPPTHPASFEQHEFAPSGRSRYFMVGPDGDRYNAWWRITAIDAPHRLEFDEGFADENWEPDATIDPTRNVVTLQPTDTGTRMVTVTTFTSAEHLQQLDDMGVVEGMRQAMGQIDKLLADG